MPQVPFLSAITPSTFNRSVRVAQIPLFLNPVSVSDRMLTRSTVFSAAPMTQIPLPLCAQGFSARAGAAGGMITVPGPDPRRLRGFVMFTLSW